MENSNGFGGNDNDREIPSQEPQEPTEPPVPEPPAPEPAPEPEPSPEPEQRDSEETLIEGKQFSADENAECGPGTHGGEDDPDDK